MSSKLSLWREDRSLMRHLIGNEAIDSFLKTGSSGIICKLDIKNVYCYVNWDFLIAFLRKMGFGKK